MQVQHLRARTIVVRGRLAEPAALWHQRPAYGEACRAAAAQARGAIQRSPACKEHVTHSSRQQQPQHLGGIPNSRAGKSSQQRSRPRWRRPSPTHC
jgi:hypothetical protein